MERVHCAQFPPTVRWLSAASGLPWGIRGLKWLAICGPNTESETGQLHTPEATGHTAVV